MPGIFLSYAREDRDCAEVLARVVKGAGHDVWWDRHIDSGEEFGAEIEAELAKADVVLVAWSKESVKSRWVRDEAAVGCDTGRLVPVSIDGSPPPMGFRQFHTLDLAGWKGGKRDGRTSELLQSIDRRAKGTRRESTPTAPAKSRRFALPTAKPVWAFFAALVLTIALATAFFIIREAKPSGPVKPTIALVPFTVASSDAHLRDLASQSRDAIAHTFSTSGLPVRLLNSAADGGGSAVDFMISGELSRNAGNVVATIRLDEVVHGVTVFSKRFEASSGDSSDLPERIGAQLAGDLTWSAPLMMLDRRRPIDPALLADLLQTTDFTGDELQAYQNVKRVAAKVPDLPIAQVGVAFDTAIVLAQIPREDRDEAIAAARRAADQALVLDPSFGDTYGAWCMLHSETQMTECENHLRAGRRVDPDAPFLNAFLSGLLGSVGRFDEAQAIQKLSYTHDPYVPTKIAWMMRTLEFSGESDAASDLYGQGLRWWPEFKRMFFNNRLSALIERGNFEGMLRLEHEFGGNHVPDDYISSAAIAAAVKSSSAAAAKRACTGTSNFWMQSRCMIALGSLGDLNGAYAIADKLYPRRVGRTPAETERIWVDEPEGTGPLSFITSPASAPLRRDPRYIAMAERVGLLTYWRNRRPPDFCRKRPESVCRQLLKSN